MMRCRSLAEMPVRRVEISNRRETTFERLASLSSTVLEVSLIWGSHSAHSKVVPSRIVQTR